MPAPRVSTVTAEESASLSSDTGNADVERRVVDVQFDLRFRTGNLDALLHATERVQRSAQDVVSSLAIHTAGVLGQRHQFRLVMEGIKRPHSVLIGQPQTRGYIRSPRPRMLLLFVDRRSLRNRRRDRRRRGFGRLRSRFVVLGPVSRLPPSPPGLPAALPIAHARR